MNATKAPTATPMITATGRDSVGKQNRAFYNNTAWAGLVDPATQTPPLTPEHTVFQDPHQHGTNENQMCQRGICTFKASIQRQLTLPSPSESTCILSLHENQA